MDINLHVQSIKGFPEVLHFNSTREGISYTKRAIKGNSSEIPRKLVWVGQDQLIHYTPVFDWYDAFSVLQSL